MGEARVTRDDIKKLVGGYATGSLTDAEKEALFEAALDDQELFDELAQEQLLKETIDAPGVRQRLVDALTPEKPAIAWWKRPWPFAVAAVVAMGVVVGVAIWPREKAPVSVAVNAPAVNGPVDKPSEVDGVTTAQIKAPEPTPLPRKRTVTSPTTESERREVANAPAPAPKPAASPAPETRPLEPPPPTKPQEAQTAKSENSVVSQTGVVGGVVGGAPSTVAPFVQQGQQQTRQPPQQQAAQAQPIPQLPSGTQSEDLKKNLRQQAGGGGAAGFGLNRAKLAASKVDAGRFGFRYRFDQQGQLEVTPLAQGYLTVRGVRAGASEKLFPGENQGRVPAGTPVYIAVPEKTTEVEVVLAASQALADERASVAADRDALAAGKRKDTAANPAGTVEDSTPSASSRVSITLPVPKR